jgi:hypothetical protein
MIQQRHGKEIGDGGGGSRGLLFRLRLLFLLWARRIIIISERK